MISKFPFRNRSIVLTWLLTYLAILLMPVAISLIVYFKSNETLKNEIHQANHSLLMQVREVMDNQFLSMERLNTELTWNVRVREMLYSNKYRIHPEEYMYSLNVITKDLNSYQMAYPSVDLFYIYSANPGLVLLPNVYRDDSFAYELHHEDEAFSYNQWSSIVNNINFKGFMPMVRIGDDGNRHSTVAYVSTYPTDNGNNVGTNVIMIDKSRILGAIENVEIFTKGNVLVLNEANHVLVSSSEDVFPQGILHDQLLAGSERFFWNHNGQKFEVSYIQSDKSNLKYVSIIPSRIFWEKAELVRNLTYASIGLSLIGGGLLSYYFLRLNYNPVRRLVQAFTGGKASHQRKGCNEFHFIQDAIDSTLSEMDRITMTMKQHNHIVRSNFLVRLLKGKLDSHIPVDESLAAFNMRFKSDDFAVLLLYFEDMGPFLEHLQGSEPRIERKLLYFVVTNVMEELAGQRHEGYVAEMDEMMACLINFSGGTEEERKAELLRIAREAQAFHQSKYRIKLTVSISGIHSSLTGISRAYMEALDAMEYKLVMGSKEILLYEEVYKGHQEVADTGYYYPLQVEQQLINFLRIGDFPMAKQLLDEVIERNLQHPVVSIPITRCMMLNLVSTLIKSEIGDEQNSYLLRDVKRVEQLIACDTIRDMQQQMTEMLKMACDFAISKRQQNIRASRQRSLDALIQGAASYIEEHYNDPNLNISMIGSHFEIQPAYISRLFKEHAGEGLLERINKIRMDKAKKLIAEHNRSISEIAACTGFNDVNVFIRTFKKYEGITPGKYREMHEE